MNTLYANGKYKVFAVVITDESAQPQHYFNVRRTQFADDEDFLTYVANLQARSLFNYPVDVAAGDELLLLSTCTTPSAAKIDNGRLTVVARKIRPGESTTENVSAIIRNDNVIMPYAWYARQNKMPHAYYSGGVSIAPNTTTTTITTTTDWFISDELTEFPEETTTFPSGGETTSTTLGTGTTTTTTLGNSKTSTTAVTSGDASSTSTSTTSTGTSGEGSTTTTQSTDTSTTSTTIATP
jgi:hypothetical protein